MLINGIAQNTSAASSTSTPFQTFANDINNIVVFSASAQFNTWFTIQTVNGVATGGFVDNTIELTLQDASNFRVGDRVVTDDGDVGVITAVNGNVITINSPSTNWTVNDTVTTETPIMDMAQRAFPQGLWWI